MTRGESSPTFGFGHHLCRRRRGRHREWTRHLYREWRGVANGHRYRNRSSDPNWSPPAEGGDHFGAPIFVQCDPDTSRRHRDTSPRPAFSYGNEAFPWNFNVGSGSGQPRAARRWGDSAIVSVGGFDHVHRSRSPPGVPGGLAGCAIFGQRPSRRVPPPTP